MTEDTPTSGGSVEIPPEILELARRTLDEVDPPAWPAAPPDASTMVRRVHALRSAPIGRLGAEDLRLLISQGVAPETLVPLALGMLRHRPLLEGDYYPGDLLLAVMRVPGSHWSAHPEQRAVLRDAVAAIDPDDPDYPFFEPGDTEFADLLARYREA